VKITKPIIIQVGQLYLHESNNAYIIITNNRGGLLSYAGPGFRGQLEQETFLELYPPVDPEDVSAEELAFLLQQCTTGTTAKVGFIQD